MLMGKALGPLNDLNSLGWMRNQSPSLFPLGSQPSLTHMTKQKFIPQWVSPDFVGANSVSVDWSGARNGIEMVGAVRQRRNPASGTLCWRLYISTQKNTHSTANWKNWQCYTSSLAATGMVQVAVISKQKLLALKQDSPVPDKFP